MSAITNLLRNWGFWATMAGVFSFCFVGLYWTIRSLAGHGLQNEWLVLPMLVILMGIAMLIMSNVTDAMARNTAFLEKQDSRFLCGTAISTTQALNDFADKMEAIIEDADEEERPPMMSRIMIEAEQCGLLNPLASNSIRTANPSIFVMDLLRESPDAYEWMSGLLMHGQQPNSENICDENDLLGAIY